MSFQRKVDRNRWREYAQKRILKFPLLAESLPGLAGWCPGASASPVQQRSAGELAIKRTNWKWWRDADRRARTAALAKLALAQVEGKL